MNTLPNMTTQPDTSDSIKEFYNRYPYPNPATVLGFAPSFVKNLAVPTNIDYTNKTICIAGCGTCEVTKTRNAAPNAKIVAVDVSERSIEISKSLDKKYGTVNVTYINDLFENIDGEFDLVIAAGVMHHTADRIAFMNKAHDVLVKGGIFRGMVYCIESRKGIRELSNFFIQNNFTIEQVREYFSKNQSELFNEQESMSIADTWLNPRFVEYDVPMLENEFNQSKWKDHKKAFQITPPKNQIYFHLQK